MDQAASYLVNRKVFPGTIQNGRFLNVVELCVWGGMGQGTHEQKEEYFGQGHFPLGAKGSFRWITFLVPIRKSRLTS